MPRSSPKYMYMFVRLKASKTDPFRPRQTIVIRKTNSPLCPISAMMTYLNSRPSSLDSGSPFCLCSWCIPNPGKANKGNKALDKGLDSRFITLDIIIFGLTRFLQWFALHFVGMKCSSRHTLAPIDSIFGGQLPPWS